MTTFTFSLRRIAGAALAITLLFATGSLQSCKDEVDASNLVTKTEATVWDYLDSVAVYSDYADLLTEVETGDGKVENSVLSSSVVVEPGARVHYSVVMPGAVIESSAVVEYAIIGENTRVCAGAHVGAPPDGSAVCAWHEHQPQSRCRF